MMQLPFPSIIKAEPSNVTFRTIKAMVREIQKSDGQDGLMCLDRAVLGHRGTWKNLKPFVPAPQMVQTQLSKGGNAALNPQATHC